MTNMSITKMISIISARPTSWLGWSSWSFAESEGFYVAALLAPVVAEISGTSRWRFDRFGFWKSFRTWSHCWLGFSSLAGGLLTGWGVNVFLFVYFTSLKKISSGQVWIFLCIFHILDNDILNSQHASYPQCFISLWVKYAIRLKLQSVMFTFCTGHKSLKCSCSGSCSTHSPTAWVVPFFPSPTPFPRRPAQFSQYISITSFSQYNLEHLPSFPSISSVFCLGVAWYAPPI